MLVDDEVPDLNQPDYVQVAVNLDTQERRLISELRVKARHASPVIICLPDGASNEAAVEAFARETEAIVHQGKAFIAVSIPNDLSSAALNAASTAAVNAVGDVIAAHVEGR